MELPTCDDRRMWDVMMSAYHFGSLTAADELGLFALLARSPAGPDEVGKALRLSPRATEALLGVVHSLGFLERHGGKFHLAEVARNFLLPESPFYWGGMLRFMRDFPFTRQAVQDALQKDRPKYLEGEDLWETHETKPEVAAAFTHAMHSRSVHLGRAVGLRCDFTGVRRFLDVAGGSGVFSMGVALANPGVRCTVAELPVVCGLAKEYVAKAGLADRVDAVAVDMFQEPLPKGYDVHFYSNIWHDWDERRCLHLAKKSIDALPSGGRILIHEILLNDAKDGPLTAATDSMHMMFFTEGKQRSAGEFGAILR